MKKLVAFLITASLLAGNTGAVFADSVPDSAVSQKKIMVYIKPDVSVKVNDVTQSFRDAKGRIVYPLLYNGSTYLPVRASSALMKEPIEWDSGSKTVFIGKTLSDPSKASGKVSEEAAIGVSDSEIAALPKPSLESAYLRPDILVMYDFEIQAFKDVNGDTVYPIIYNGSTYLPVRAISKLIGAPIEWDGTLKTVSISIHGPEAAEEEEETATPAAVDTTPGAVNTTSGAVNTTSGAVNTTSGAVNTTSGAVNTTPGAVDTTPAAVNTSAPLLKDLFGRTEVLYYEATGHATAINTASAENKKLIAAAITDNCMKVQELTLEIKGTDQTDFTDAEKAALQKLSDYADSTGYYILVLENIAYMAVQGSDYSGLADTFLYFAMDSQNKMEAARAAVQAL
ncbi:MAG TPA: stalk domain-containing protein [Bacillota bacterium]|nr:stalk domain-containing protein [Bacillota bacterium]